MVAPYLWVLRGEDGVCGRDRSSHGFSGAFLHKEDVGMMISSCNSCARIAWETIMIRQ